MLPASPPSSTQRPSDARAGDIALASRAAAGDEAAFADLYRRHHPHVYRYCRRLLRCPEDAADATQQAFLSMHRRLAKGCPPDASVGGYLLRVARHASFDVRSGARRSRPSRSSAASSPPSPTTSQRL
jgi:RNA polymerase sigma-70 factor, ECF subfamily